MEMKPIKELEEYKKLKTTKERLLFIDGYVTGLKQVQEMKGGIKK